jgi:hypothetical protein
MHAPQFKFGSCISQFNWAFTGCGQPAADLNLWFTGSTAAAESDWLWGSYVRFVQYFKL